MVQVRAKYVPPAGFLLALFCFLLPFMTLSCPAGQFTFSGLQLATGTTINEPQMFGEAKEREISGEPLALTALICALAGVAVGFVVSRPARMLGVGLGALGAILLLMLKGKIAFDVLREGGGMLQVSYGAGYWLAVLGFLAASALNLFAFKRMPASAAGEPRPAIDL